MTAATTRRPPATHRRHDAVAALRAVRAFALLATLTLAAAACAGHRGPRESDYQTNVGLSADSTLRIARTQLQLHAFTVTAAGENALVTTPRPVPEHLQGGSPGLRGRHWMLRVETQRRALVGGTRLRVIGYLLPPPATDPRASGPTAQPATLITSDQAPLFSEVRAAGRWIEDAAGRKKR